MGDRGKARIPTLKTVDSAGQARDFTTNEEKSVVFLKIFFPKRPDSDLIPADPVYPCCVNYSFRPSMAQLRRCVARLSPYKAPGEDDIPNVMIKESIELIAEYLLEIYCATFTLNTYSDHWRDTIVLCKPGKPRYDLPKAHQPIALMNTLGKLLSALVAEDLVHMCEIYGLLPDNHFGSRPSRCTTDMMHLLVHKIKVAWHQCNVVAILFLDVEGAFPNAVTAQLHNMHMRQVLEEYVCFIGHLLTDWRTRLKFDGFTLDWIDIDNGIVQGDPLSMVLYLFYNADLLMDMGKMETKVGYVDNVNFFVEGPTFEAAYAMLNNMMTCEGGSQEWSRNHNSKFKMLKLTLVGFSHRHTQDQACPGKTVAEPRPNFMLDGTTIKPTESHKFVGVAFDQKLCWRVQAERVVAKATKWTLATRQLARPAAGKSPWQMRQLYQAVAIPSLMYAADIWFTPVQRDGLGRSSSSAGVVCKLTTVQCMATMVVTGALFTTATDMMEAHANLLPVELMMNRICFRATLCLTALPETHPLFKPVKQSS